MMILELLIFLLLFNVERARNSNFVGNVTSSINALFHCQHYVTFLWVLMSSS